METFPCHNKNELKVYGGIFTHQQQGTPWLGWKIAVGVLLSMRIFPLQPLTRKVSVCVENSSTRLKGFCHHRLKIVEFNLQINFLSFETFSQLNAIFLSPQANFAHQLLIRF